MLNRVTPMINISIVLFGIIGAQQVNNNLVLSCMLAGWSVTRSVLRLREIVEWLQL